MKREIDTNAIVPWGEGSSGGETYQPVELPDNLRSEATVEILLMIGEGVIQGFTREKDRSIFFDGTPMRRFEGAKAIFRRGLLNQKSIKQFSLAAQESPVGVKVTKNNPVVRTIEDPNTDGLRIRCSASGLISYEDDGDIRGSEFTVQIEVANRGEGFKVKRKKKIEGKSAGQFQFDFRIRLDAGKHPWRVRVSRLNDDSETTRETNDFHWQAYSQLLFNRFKYPRTALLGLRFKAEFFNTLPSISVLLDGLIIRVPTNYDPVTRTYSGIWDGTFKQAHTNNPAWCLFDMLTDTLYGAGEYIGVDKIDKWSLYAIGQYCDERVPKPGGGVEPRFTFNAYIQNREDAYQVIGAMLSVFRGMMFEANAGFLYVSADRPSTPVRIYSESNVIQEVDEQGNITKPPFQYAGTSAKVRHTVALVSYLDQNDRYRRKIAYVQDIPGIQRYGYRETEITAFGCTSRGQATRLGRWTLLSEQLETATITFTVGSDGMLARPGEIIAVADPAVTGTRTGGRVRSYNPATGILTIDQQHFINQLSRIMLINSTGSAYEVPVLNTPNTISDQFLVGALADPPQPETPYVYLFVDTLEPQQFRVQSIKEGDNGTYEIVAVEHNPSKFNAVDFDTNTEELPVSLIPSPLTAPPPVDNLNVVESLYVNINSSGVKVRLDVGWGHGFSFFPVMYHLRYKHLIMPAPSTAANFADGIRLFQQVFAAVEQAPWQYASPTPSRSFVFNDMPPGYYLFEVTAVNSYGVPSAPAQTSIYAYGLLKPPATPTNFRSTGTSVDRIGLRWDESPDIDVRVGGSFEIRYSPLFTTNWNAGQVAATVAGHVTTVEVALQSGTYMIKAIDSSGIRSINAAFVQADYRRITTTNFVFLDQFDFAFGNGTSIRRISNTDRTTSISLSDDSFFDSKSGLFDSATGNFDDAGNGFSALSGNLLDYANVRFDRLVQLRLEEEGWWEHPPTYDIGDVFNCKVTGAIDARSFLDQNTLTAIPGLFDWLPGTFDGNEAGFATAEIQIQTSANMEDWSAWERFEPRIYAARGFRFRVYLKTTNLAYNCRVNSGFVSVDMPERIESGFQASITTGPTWVAFPNGGFYAPPEIGITIQSMTLGDVHFITGLTSRGFNLTITNGGPIVSRNFTWMARGYGRAVA